MLGSCNGSNAGYCCAKVRYQRYVYDEASNAVLLFVCKSTHLWTVVTAE